MGTAGILSIWGTEVTDPRAVSGRVVIAPTLAQGREIINSFVPESHFDIIHLYVADGNLYWREAFTRGHTLKSQRVSLFLAMESWNQALSLCYLYNLKHNHIARVILRNLIRLHAQLRAPFRRRAEWIHRDIEHDRYGKFGERMYLKAHVNLANRLGHYEDADGFACRLKEIGT